MVIVEEPAVSGWRSKPVAGVIEDLGRWLLVAAVASAMLTARTSIGSVHLGASDLLVVGGVACWGMAWAGSRTRPAMLGVAKWPALAMFAGIVSMTASADLAASLKGLVELLGLWVLPALAIGGLVTSDLWRRRLLSAASAGSLVAAAINIIVALRIGFSAGLPQVWGAADGFQGYFQVVGIAVAFPRLAAALSERRTLPSAGWSAALVLHAMALLLTQTRGAWLAALVAAAVLGVVWRRAMVVVVVGVVGAAILVAVSADWAAVIRERALSVIGPQASGAAFDSSVIRVALALSAWSMFVAHPLTGIGLKTFAMALPYYAPTGLPLAVEMGPDRVLTPIEGPHSTYLSLLAETGLIGAVAVVGWIATAWLASHRWSRALPVEAVERRQIGATVLGAIAAVAVFSLFGEMNAAGALPLVAVLALGYGLGGDVQQQRRATHL